MKKTRHTQAKAFSIVELLIALAITAILMVAVASAFEASIVNYSQNEDIFRTVNTARQALLRMTTEIRTATEVLMNSEPSSQCTFLLADGVTDITYKYDSSEMKLYLVDNDSGQEYVLCDNVTAMSFSKGTAFDKDGLEYVKSVQISITVVSGSESRTVSAAAVIRRNMQ